MPSRTPQDPADLSATEPAPDHDEANGPGPTGGTWAHADWTARLRPTTSRAVTAYPMRGVWLVEIAAPLTEVGDEVAQTVRLALAESPRGVVLELEVAPNLWGPDGLGRLASSGRHPWAWPAAPVAVASTDPQVKARLQQHAYGRSLVHCSSMLQGWAQIMNTEPALTTHLGWCPTPRPQSRPAVRGQDLSGLAPGHPPLSRCRHCQRADRQRCPARQQHRPGGHLGPLRQSTAHCRPRAERHRSTPAPARPGRSPRARTAVRPQSRRPHRQPPHPSRRQPGLGHPRRTPRPILTPVPCPRAPAAKQDRRQRCSLAGTGHGPARDLGPGPSAPHRS